MLRRNYFLIGVLVLIIAIPMILGCRSPFRVMTIEQIQQMTVHPPVYGQDVQLTDGRYEGGEGSEYLSVSLAERTAIGDLNGDCRDEAVVLLAENGGGSAVFVSLIVFQIQENQIVQGPSYYIDDRPVVNTLSISEGVIKLDATIHGPGDAMVNPTFETVQRFELEGDRLVLVRLCSIISEDVERSIEIDSPVEGQVVNGTVQLTGSMPIGPFENNLRLSVVDGNGSELLVAPFMVDAPDMGAPATFDRMIDLSALAGGQTVRIMLTEVSMADGSTICMNSVAAVLP